MNARIIILLVCLAIIAMLALLLYISARDRLSAYELRRGLDQIKVDIQAIEKTVARDRHILNDAHKQISRVTKALQKPTR